MRPLEGRVVLVTRPADQAGELVELLEERGATAIEAPAIEIVPVASKALEQALRELVAGEFEWLVLTSRAGVDALSASISSGEGRARIAAVGDGTADALRAWGRDPDLVPRTFTTEALGRAMPRGSGRVLLARADIAPAGLEDALRAKGWTPVRVDAYRTRMPRSLPPEARVALREGLVDAVSFTSASTVRGFVRGLGIVRGNPKVVCIGPVTSRAAREAGFRVAAVARPHTIEGLVAAMERVFTPRARRKART
ncbi:MAG: uroporphyrinogen-III synthase [Actinomycetota bacterium]